MRIQWTHYYQGEVYCRCLYDAPTLTTDQGVYTLDGGVWAHVGGQDDVSSTQLEAIKLHIEAIYAARPE